MTTEISNMDDVIDSREVIARIEELQGERDALCEAIGEAQDALKELPADASIDEQKAAHQAVTEAEADCTAWDAENMAELTALAKLDEEASGYASDWKYGETLIRESYFKDYAMELAEDIGAINKDATWPNTCIDWDQAARELRMDYTGVEFDGVTYYVR